MTPTIVLHNQKPVLALGAPGGTKIISCVAEVLLNYLEYHLPLYESVNAIRLHHQWKPDELLIDAPGPTTGVLDQLRQMGYTAIQVEPDAVDCRVMAVARENGDLLGVSDPRDNGSSAGI
jgi:gamma-glutamyltranspeptidase/glutathione hydrolase